MAPGSASTIEAQVANGMDLARGCEGISTK